MAKGVGFEPGSAAAQRVLTPRFVEDKSEEVAKIVGSLSHSGNQGRMAWRREWDSNPRYGFPYTRFPSVRLQPLGHPSSPALATAQPGRASLQHLRPRPPFAASS